VDNAAPIAPAARHDLAAPELRAFFQIVEKWGLTTDQARCLLGSPGRTTYFCWKRGQPGPLPADTLERISYVLGIYKNLHLIFCGSATGRYLGKTPQRGNDFRRELFP